MQRCAPVLRLALIAIAANLGMGFAAAANTCQLNSAGGKIKHVIYIQFDNVHLHRDNPNVPSDLEQMPHLLNFITQNGTLDPNHHAVLISHTAIDILTSLTGVYSDRHGIAVANSYPVFTPSGSTEFVSSFFYWTDLVSDVDSYSLDNTFGMLTANGLNAPAPWVPFTRAGCDVGAFSTANIVLERTPFDVVKVFGAGSPEANDSDAFGNYIGVAVHCAQGSAICGNASTKAVADLLPEEPGGYNGYQAIFGMKYLNQVTQLKDIDGNPMTTFDNISFDPTASQTLGAIATMQEAGIPISITYIADAHDDHVNFGTFGPGEAGYVAQLQSYDAAFEAFFARLKTDGIDQTNTLFIITADEGDHFAGGAPVPANCDGVTVTCTYPQIGELDTNLNGLASAAGNNTSFSIHFDLAPTVNITGNPSYKDPITRSLEQLLSSITVVNPYTNQTEPISAAMADPVEMGLLHMITDDPARTPTFTMFGLPDYYFQSYGSNTPTPGPGYAWNHGGIQPEIAQTFLGMVGPGVLPLGGTPKQDQVGQDGGPIQFSDHVDIRPTMMALLGLKDDYVSDGRVLLEILHPAAMSHSLTAHSPVLLKMGEVYKQINAPFGDLGQTSLQVSTAALASNTTNDAMYEVLESKIRSWTTQRNAIASQMKAILQGAEFGGEPANDFQAESLAWQGLALLDKVHHCAANITVCAQ